MCLQSLGKSKQVQQDCQKKEQESRSSVAKLKAKFLSSCQEMGIKVCDFMCMYIHVSRCYNLWK